MCVKFYVMFVYEIIVKIKVFYWVVDFVDDCVGFENVLKNINWEKGLRKGIFKLMWFSILV